MTTNLLGILFVYGGCVALALLFVYSAFSEPRRMRAADEIRDEQFRNIYEDSWAWIRSERDAVSELERMYQA